MKLLRWWKLPIALVALALPTQYLLSTTAGGAATTVLATGFTPASIAQEEFQAGTATVAPGEALTLPTSNQPFELSPEQLAYYNARIASAGPSPLQMGPQSLNIAGPEPGSETVANTPDPNAPGTFVQPQNRLVPGGTHSNINEPSLAQDGGYIFYTGNWHAAYSKCGGNAYGFPQFCDGGDFVFVNPYADMPDFCCDQDTIADNRREIIIWYRQGIYNHPSGPATQNRFRLGVSYSAFSPQYGGCFYNFTPAGVNAAWTNQWFDYPHIALSNDYLWIVTNRFTGAGGFAGQVWFKMPLDALANCAGFSYSFFDPGSGWNGWGTLVQGATTQMYFASHGGTNNSLNIWWWNEDSGTIYVVNRAIPAFTFQNRNSNCTARPAGTLDWTNRGDSRLQAGWVRHRHVTAASAGALPPGLGEAVGEVGFMWNANSGGGFTQPYEEAAAFRQDTLTLLPGLQGRPYVFGGDCWQYAHASPNHSGDIGVAINASGTGFHVSDLFLIDDDYNGPPPGWEAYFTQVGGGGPPSNSWGDYNRARPNYPSAYFWVASGHTMQGGVVQSRYFAVGRERDLNSYYKTIWNIW